MDGGNKELGAKASAPAPVPEKSSEERASDSEGGGNLWRWMLLRRRMYFLAGIFAGLSLTALPWNLSGDSMEGAFNGCVRLPTPAFACSCVSNETLESTHPWQEGPGTCFGRSPIRWGLFLLTGPWRAAKRKSAARVGHRPPCLERNQQMGVFQNPSRGERNWAGNHK